MIFIGSSPMTEEYQTIEGWYELLSQTDTTITVRIYVIYNCINSWQYVETYEGFSEAEQDDGINPYLEINGDRHYYERDKYIVDAYSYTILYYEDRTLHLSDQIQTIEISGRERICVGNDIFENCVWEGTISLPAINTGFDYVIEDFYQSWGELPNYSAYMNYGFKYSLIEGFPGIRIHLILYRKLTASSYFGSYDSTGVISFFNNPEKVKKIIDGTHIGGFDLTEETESMYLDPNTNKKTFNTGEIYWEPGTEVTIGYVNYPLTFNSDGNSLEEIITFKLRESGEYQLFSGTASDDDYLEGIIKIPVNIMNIQPNRLYVCIDAQNGGKWKKVKSYVYENSGEDSGEWKVATPYLGYKSDTDTTVQWY